MIPKHVHEAALEKACNVYDRYTGDILPDAYLKSHIEHHKAAMDIAIAAYLSHIAGDAEVIEGVAEHHRNSTNHASDGNIPWHNLHAHDKAVEFRQAKAALQYLAGKE
jgi:hypothetical protein